MLFGGIFTAFKNMILEFAQTVFSIINAMSNDFWEHELIRIVIAFLYTVSNIVLVFAIIIMVIDIAEESNSNPINWGIVAGNFMKGFTFANFAITLGISMSTISTSIVSSIPMGMYTSDGSFWEKLTNLDSISSLLIVSIVILVGSISFFIMSLNRFASMFVYVFGSIFYIPDIVRGETSAMGAWLHQAVVLSTTYIIQYLFFSIGTTLIVDNWSNFILGVACYIGMFVTSKTLGKYGASSGVKGAFSSIAQQGFSVAKAFIK